MKDFFNDKPYIDFKFVGVESFTDLLSQAGTEFSIIDFPELNALFEEDDVFLKPDDDTVVLGFASRDGMESYFLEYGIMIAPDIGARSYVVFVFDHQPDMDEIRSVTGEIESLINGYLEEVNQDISEDSGGKTIN